MSKEVEVHLDYFRARMSQGSRSIVFDLSSLIRIAEALLRADDAMQDYQRFAEDGPLDEVIDGAQYARLRAALLERDT